jgi:hypothetical protein
MILLTSTSDLIQVITGQAAQIDVHASYVDLASGAVTAGRTNTRISTATTTTVVGSPAASTTRNVKILEVGNNHATASCTVSIQHTDGTNVIVIEQVTLAPLERISYVEGIGIRVFDAIGREKVPTPILPAGSGNTADVVANAANTALGNVYLGGRVVAGSAFFFRGRMTKTAAGVAAATLTIATGPNGTTADTARVTHTLGSQTAATDDGLVEISAIIRALGASAVIQSVLNFIHTNNATGLDSSAGPTTPKRIQSTSSTFTLGASDYMTFCCNPGASGVWTFQEALIIPVGLIG